jgi:hypothetical protein
MFPLDYLLAAALLTAPPDAVDPADALDAACALAPEMQRLALSWEVLDAREVRFVLTRREDLKTDLDLLRRRADDLADAPPLHDCMRFPPRAVVVEMLGFNRAYREQLERRMEVEASRAWEFREALNEVDRLHRIWDAIRDSRCDYYYITVRRRALKTVRDTIGEQAFYNGDIPPHVPLWRFQRID